jgi:hypothetical protein
MAITTQLPNASSNDMRIAASPIIGVTEIDTRSDHAFSLDAPVDVLIHLKGDIPAVQVRAIRRDAQNMYAGRNRLTAIARANGPSNAPVIVGDYVIEAYSLDGRRIPQFDYAASA